MGYGERDGRGTFFPWTSDRGEPKPVVVSDPRFGAWWRKGTGRGPGRRLGETERDRDPL